MNIGILELTEQMTSRGWVQGVVDRWERMGGAYHFIVTGDPTWRRRRSSATANVEMLELSTPIFRMQIHSVGRIQLRRKTRTEAQLFYGVNRNRWPAFVDGERLFNL